LLNAFNDNLFKNAMVLFVVYSVYNSEEAEAQFSAVASGLFILPFFLLSAMSGQLADMRDKAVIIRWVKLAEIFIMAIGAAGLLMAWQGLLTEAVAIPLMLVALFAMGVHSTFFGPIKYAILPQHLEKDEVLSGTGLVEAGTYIAILAGTILAGYIDVQWAALGVVLTAVVGYATSRQVPPAPPYQSGQAVDWHLLRSSIALVRNTMHHREEFYAILAISFFWTIGAVLFIQFPPLAKSSWWCSRSAWRSARWRSTPRSRATSRPATRRSRCWRWAGSSPSSGSCATNGALPRPSASCSASASSSPGRWRRRSCSRCC
jgi:hypothetical protein